MSVVSVGTQATSAVMPANPDFGIADPVDAALAVLLYASGVGVSK